MKEKIKLWYVYIIDYLSQRSLILFLIGVILYISNTFTVYIQDVNILKYIFLNTFLFVVLSKILKTEYYNNLKNTKIKMFQFITPNKVRFKLINFSFLFYFSMLCVLISSILFILENVYEYHIDFYINIAIFLFGYFTLDSLIYSRYKKYKTTINTETIIEPTIENNDKSDTIDENINNTEINI